jgi:hypothetical protein
VLLISRLVPVWRQTKSGFAPGGREIAYDRLNSHHREAHSLEDSAGAGSTTCSSQGTRAHSSLDIAVKCATRALAKICFRI